MRGGPTTGPWRAWPRAFGLVIALLWGCSILAPFRLGALPGADADADAEADADVDAQGDPDGDAQGDPDGDVHGDAPDGEAPLGPGPVSFVLDRVALTMDRRCDVDGNGSLDNAIADLGADAGARTLGAMNAVLATQIQEGFRYVVHLPWVEDRDRPHDREVVLTVFRGLVIVDEGSPPDDPLDDFSGHEEFWAWWRYLDGCGEPIFALPVGGIDAGELAALGGSVFAWLGEMVQIERARVEGRIEPRGRRLAFSACGIATIHALGGIGHPFSSGLSMLEGFVAGGAVFGIPSVPGLNPDVDLDGDGLERVLVGEDNGVSGCIDGDLTYIDGADCWSDPRMADGFSLTVEGTGVPALFRGREPGWEARFPEGCPEPPEPSLFDPR